MVSERNGANSLAGSVDAEGERQLPYQEEKRGGTAADVVRERMAHVKPSGETGMLGCDRGAMETKYEQHAARDNTLGDGHAQTKLKLKVKFPGSAMLPQKGNEIKMDPNVPVEDDVDEEDWDDEEAQRQAELVKRRKMIAPVLLTDEELNSMDDEVEMVIMHRDLPNVREHEGQYNKIPLSGQAAWKYREFYVKWARCSHIHNSWDTNGTLSQLGGFKRVMNYCKKVDAAAARRCHMTVEEKEEADFRLSLEQEIEKEHSQVERIFGERLKEVLGLDEHGNQITSRVEQYLCKWKGLPYAESTWESKEDIERIGAMESVELFQRREAAALEPRQSVDAARRTFAESGHRALAQQPEFLKEGQLRDYQLEGLNWMVYNWARGVNGRFFFLSIHESFDKF